VHVFRFVAVEAVKEEPIAARNVLDRWHLVSSLPHDHHGTALGNGARSC
jgi:hypothetical protein